MKYWWNDIDSGRVMYSEKTLYHCYLIRNKSHID